MKHRALAIGAGRIGAGWKWHDDAYTHAGAYRALSDRVELVGFVEPDKERAKAAEEKWGKAAFGNVSDALANLQPDIVSVCVQPEQQSEVLELLAAYKPDAVWCEKPYMGDRPYLFPIQVNYMRRGDPDHRLIAECDTGGKLIVYGKDDLHTRCHFEDLRGWWKAELDYRVFNGPCAYVYRSKDDEIGDELFDNGGVDGGICFKAMLGNLLDHVDNGTPLWSPAHGL